MELTFQTYDFILHLYRSPIQTEKEVKQQKNIVPVTCRLHIGEMCVHSKRRRMGNTVVPSRLNFIHQTHSYDSIEIKDEMSLHCCFFCKSNRIAYKLSIRLFVVFTKQMRWWRNSIFSVVEGRFVLCTLEINQDDDQRRRSLSLSLFVCRFSVLYFNHFAFHFLCLNFMPSYNHHQSIEIRWFCLCKWITHNVDAQF